MKEMNDPKETLWARMRDLPSVTKLYLIFNAVAIVFSAVIGAIYSVSEPNALGACAKTILTFYAFYILVAVLSVSLQSMYNQGRNIVAVIIPMLMTVVGQILSFWLYDEYLGDRINISTIAVTALTIVLVPLIGLNLSRVLSLKTGKLYTLCFLQIFITALIAWLEFSFLI